MLYTWGSGSSYQTAQATTADLLIPTQVLDSPWIKLATGLAHTIGLHADGSLWVWGSNSGGQCGVSSATINPVVEPRQIGVLTGFVDVFAGPAATFAIAYNTSGGALYSCGALMTGRGSGVYSFFSTVGSTPYNWKAVSCMYRHAHGIRANGELWSWGQQQYGKLGNNTDSLSNWSYTPVRADSNQVWKEAHAGEEHSIGIKHDGSLWGWGLAGAALGGITPLGYLKVPTLISSEVWTMAAVTMNATLALKADGTLWSTGIGDNGVLGHGDLAHKAVLTQIGTNSWTHIYAGRYHVLGIDTQKRVWVWGLNENGQLGLGDVVMRMEPTRLGDYKTP